MIHQIVFYASHRLHEESLVMVTHFEHMQCGRVCKLSKLGYCLKGVYLAHIYSMRIKGINCKNLHKKGGSQNLYKYVRTKKNLGHYVCGVLQNSNYINFRRSQLSHQHSSIMTQLLHFCVLLFHAHAVTACSSSGKASLHLLLYVCV